MARLEAYYLRHEATNVNNRSLRIVFFLIHISLTLYFIIHPRDYANTRVGFVNK